MTSNKVIGARHRSSPHSVVPMCEDMLATKRERKVEIGHFDKIKSLHVIIYHECFPTWFLLFDALDCLSITIVGCIDVDSFVAKCASSSNNCSEVFITTVMGKIGLDKFRFVPHLGDSHHGALRLVSGTLAFIVDSLRHIGAPFLVVLDSHFGGRLRRGTPCGLPAPIVGIQWHRMQHRSFGGPTSAISLVGVSSYLSVSLSVSTLRRSIRDIFNAGERPDRIPSSAIARALGARPSDTTRDFYIVDDILHPNRLCQPVVHATHFLGAGWGSRSLTGGELGAAFGYPRQWHSLLPPWVFQLPPYQVLFAIFRAVVTSVSVTIDTSSVLPSVESTPTLVPMVLPSTRTWLPSILSWLPHTWANKLSSPQTKVKRDDAAVPSLFWDRRNTLVFGDRVGPLLVTLRRLCLCRSRRNLLTDFRAHMVSKYGTSWSIALRYWRSLAGQGVPRHKGGKGVCFQPDNTNMNDHRHQLQPFDVLRLHDYPPEVVNRLLHDCDIACKILTQYNKASWWEWNMGSTLIYWRWNGEDEVYARDGFKPFIKGTLPNWSMKRPKKILEPKFSLIIKKLRTIIERNYLTPGKVSSWTDFFDVPKGEDDIRLVYNGTIVVG